MSDKSNDLLGNAFLGLRPNARPSTELIEKVASLATAAEKRKGVAELGSRDIRLTAALLLTAGAAGLVVFQIIFASKLAFARTVRTVSLNVFAARGYHSRVQFVHDGKPSISIEAWFREGKSRQESEINGVRFVEIRANGRSLYYQVGADHASAQAIGKDGDGLVNLTQIRSQVQDMLASSQLENLGKVSENGRTLLEVAKYADVKPMPFLKAKPGRSLAWIDLDQMLPSSLEEQVRENGKWVTALHCDFDFNQSVPLSKFSPPQPGFVVADLNALGTRVGLRFLRTIATAQIGNQVIAIRDAQVNRDGDVFVMYTNGSTRSNWKQDTSYSEFKDDLGTTYASAAGAVEPYMYCSAVRESRGIVVGNQTMQGICLVPVNPDVPKRLPRSLSLIFECPAVSGLNRKRLTVPLRHVQSLLPDYAASLASLMLPGGQATNYRIERALARDAYFENGDKLDCNGLLSATDCALRDGVTTVNVYLSRAKAFSGLHRWADARQTLIEARNSDNLGFAQDMIVDAEAKLKAAQQNANDRLDAL